MSQRSGSTQNDSVARVDASSQYILSLYLSLSSLIPHLLSNRPAAFMKEEDIEKTADLGGLTLGDGGYGGCSDSDDGLAPIEPNRNRRPVEESSDEASSEDDEN